MDKPPVCGDFSLPLLNPPPPRGRGRI